MIRLAEMADLPAILPIYEAARRYMRESGNPTQWGDSNPPRATLEEDIRLRQLYVDIQNNTIHGAFAFILGEEPTYAHIEGAWLNDAPYGTIHRIAGDGTVKGIFARCIDFCKAKTGELRIDTHENNRTMRHLIVKHGFQECGIIHIADGTPRIAFQYSKTAGQPR